MNFLDEADRLAQLATSAAEKYGPLSQAVVFLKYEELIRLRFHERIDGHSAGIVDRIARTEKIIHDSYAHELVSRSDHPTRIVSGPPVLIEFDRDVFDREYAAVAGEVTSNMWIVQSCAMPDGMNPGAPHMFVVDDHGRLLVWRRPFSFRELIFGRTKSRVNGVPVAHPMLVPQRLKALAAGEIVLVGDTTIEAVIANTKSGHFRPPPSAGQVLHALCIDVLGVDPAKVAVFTAGGTSDQDHAAFTIRVGGRGHAA